MKTSITILLLLLAVWMGASQYVWLCLVKGHCAATAAGTDAMPAVNANPSNAAQPSVEAAVVQASETAAQTDLSPLPAPVEITTLPAEELAVAQHQADSAPPALAPEQNELVMRVVPVEMNGELVFAPKSGIGLTRNSAGLTQATAAARNIAGWLESNPHVDLTVVGVYGANETNRSEWSNLGIARANALIDQLINAGVARRRLMALDERNSVESPALRLLATDFSWLFQPFRVYFPSSSTRLSSNSELERYAGEVSTYLQRHPAAIVRVIGHTDESGPLQNNYSLGLARAREVATLLNELGVPEARLDIDSKGESEPVAANDSDAGKALNRRVELQLTSR